MAKFFPDTIPAQYADNEKFADAYTRGWNHGHGLACHNVPTLGEKVFSETLGRVTVDAENIREVHADNCIAAESNSRCYSPFEFTAHEFNSDETDSETLWEAFETGTYDAINADLSEYTDEHYGIEDSE